MPANSIEALVDAMTLEEQVSLLSGEDFWSLPAVPRLGIGKLRVTDGPNGARGGGSLIGGVRAAAFPVGIALGASWDPDLVREVAGAIAEEARDKGAHVVLGPTINIQRSVTNGRNFECYAEDPCLTAALAAAYVEGMQAAGVAATPKHFAGNESEIERTTISSEIDARALREVYLAPFEAAVRAGAWAIMTGYNRLNGTFASEHPWLLGEVLRDEWGFDGVAMSDWFGSHSTAPTVNAGLDLEMPGPPRDRGPKLVAAVEAGEVPRETVRERALAILRLMERTGALATPVEIVEGAEDRPAHRALIRRAGAAGAVLLKNDGDLLPLDPATLGRVAVIGPNARVARIMGGGSSQLNPHYAVTPWDGLAAALGPERLTWAPGCDNHRFEPLLAGPLCVEWFASDDFSGGAVLTETWDEAQAFLIGRLAEGRVDPNRFSLRLTGTYTPEALVTHRVGVHSAGRARVLVGGTLVADAWTDWRPGRTFFEEGCDPVVGEIALDAGRAHAVTVEFAAVPDRSLGVAGFHVGIGRPLGDAAIAEAAETARGADAALVFVGRSGEWDTEGSDLEDITLPGRQDELVAAVAAANPRTVVVLQTGGPVEMPWLDAVPAVLQAWYPGQECGNAIADVLLGAAEPGGRLAQTFPVRWSDNPTASRDPEVYPGRDGRVRYAEGVFVGQRHYERAGVAPLFPFGHGHGYASFEIEDLVAEPTGPAVVRVTASLRNVCDRAGATVLQIYVRPPAAPVERPTKELRAFARVALGPGETATVERVLAARDFAWFDADADLWRVDPGPAEILAGFSAADIRARAPVTIAEALSIAP
jgi:beta-glucosidase